MAVILPSGGFTQQHDKAELVAVVLLAEAVADQQGSFLQPILRLVDNKWISYQAQPIFAGGGFKPSIAHVYWWRRVQAAIAVLPEAVIVN